MNDIKVQDLYDTGQGSVAKVSQLKNIWLSKV